LTLRFVLRDDKTVLSERHHHGPLLVQRPFYPEEEACHVYILHPPGGVAGGDQLLIDIGAEPDSRVLLTTPAAGKFYQSRGPMAYQTVKINVARNADLEWFPQENIAFSGARAGLHTEIDLTTGARVIAWDSVCLGRPASGEHFDDGRLINALLIRRDGVPLLSERLDVAADSAIIDAAWGLRGHAVVATMVATPAASGMLAAVRECCVAVKRGIAAPTLIGDLLVLRYLGGSVAEANRIFQKSWEALRPGVLQRNACLPRIWAT